MAVRNCLIKAGMLRKITVDHLGTISKRSAPPAFAKRFPKVDDNPAPGNDSHQDAKKQPTTISAGLKAVIGVLCVDTVLILAILGYVAYQATSPDPPTPNGTTEPIIDCLLTGPHVADAGCICMMGYQADDSKCVDENECLYDNGGCGHICINIPGSYICTCSGGQQELNNSCSEPSGSGPVLFDECTANTHGCSATCTDEINGYSCGCLDGFELQSDKRTCSDLNECNHDNGGCSHACTNLIGSYRCTCPPEFTISDNGHLCLDIDECSSANGGCSDICLNSYGSFSCSCQLGYILTPSLTCEAVPFESCTSQNGGCSHDCNSTDHGVICSCPNGYHLLSGKLCLDTDECSEQTDACDQSCENTDGGYICHCSTGWSLSQDNHTCEDVDECAIGNGGCDHTCVNAVGSFACSCNEGAVMENKMCTYCAASVDCAVPGVPRDCQDIYNYGYNETGAYVCAICSAGVSVSVRCEMDETTNSGWTVMLRRTAGQALGFFRKRDEYRQGFGDPREELWLGLEYVHNLTYSQPYMLQVEVTERHLVSGYANYDIFEIASDADGYEINVGGYTAGSPSAGNALTHSSYSSANVQGRKFSTPEAEHDYDTTSLAHCSRERGAGWWMKACQRSCLTAHYKQPGMLDSWCMNWATYTSNANRCLVAGSMRLKPIAN